MCMMIWCCYIIFFFFFWGAPNPFKILEVRLLLTVNVFVLLLVVELCCNLLRINDKGKRGWYVALCVWAAKADGSIVCFGAKPDKGFLDMKSRRIRKWYGDANGSGRRDPAEGSWRLDSREVRQHGIGSSESESRWVWFQ